MGRSHSGEFPESLDPARQLWFAEGLAARWRLDSATLGILQTGVGMAFDTATLIPRVGKLALIDYAERSFGAFDTVLAALAPGQMDDSRNSVMEFTGGADGVPIAEAAGSQTTIGADVGFHLSHDSRHLGMMEALKDLRDRSGTATR